MAKGKIQAAVKNVVDGIVRHSDPERIVLFGSAARNPSGAVNDLDFLVIVRDSQAPAAVMDALNLNIRHKPMPCDFLVATPSLLRKHKEDADSVYAVALREGREVYAR